MKRILRLALALCLLASCAGADALDPTAFSKKVSFTASGYDGTSTLENFPVLVRLSEGISGFSYDDIGTTTNAAYANLRFADASHANLDYEIETWDPAGTSFVWVSLPTLSGTGTRFGAYYSPFSGASLPDVHPTNVWTSAGYVGVWHMNFREGSKTSGKFFSSVDGTPAFQNATWDGAINATDTANGTLWHVENPSLYVPARYTADWNFSATGYTGETWFRRREGSTTTYWRIFTDAAALSDTSNEVTLTAFGDVALKGVNRKSVWTEGLDDWRHLSVLCVPAGSTDQTVLCEANTNGVSVLISSSGNKAVDMVNGMGVTGFIGVNSSNGHHSDEVRVRRGLSTTDWIQANWDAQRVGTDFLSVEPVRDPRVPFLSSVAETSATAVLDHPLDGAGTVKAFFVNFATKATNEVSVADPVHPAATATGLAPDCDYDVRFVVEEAGETVLATFSAPFVTAGGPTLRPQDYRHSVTFTATGYDGAEKLEHFPVLLHLSETEVPGFSYAGVDPSDIRFTAADGTLLAHEVETWDPAGLSTIWVSLPTLSGTDTAFTMHWKPYHGMGVAAQPVHRVWHCAGYECVIHLNERLGDDGTSYERWDERPFALYYADSSGWGRHATKGTTLGSSPDKVWRTSLMQTSPTNGPVPVSANGSPALETLVPLIIPPTVAGGMDFSASGYSAEVWFNPEHGGSQSVFMTGNGVLNSMNAIFADNWSVGALSCNWNMRLNPEGGNSRVSYTGVNGYTGTNVWHFLTANWAPAGAATPTAIYAGNPTVPASFRGCNYSATAVAQDISASGIGLTGSVGASSGGLNGRFVDELRLRRGRSSEAWIQANWDTQRLGTDFLSAGPVLDRLLPTLLLIH